MKVLIVFLSIFIINISLLTYQSDVNRFNNIQETIKNLSDEGAASSSLYYDEVEYSMGYLVANRDEAIKHLEFLFSHMKNQYINIEIASIEYYIYFFDQSNKMYAYKNGSLVSENLIAMPYYFIDENNNTIIIREPSVVLNVNLSIKDIFRLPFIKQESVSRSSMYEIKARGQN